jgi:hypothetical protein
MSDTRPTYAQLLETNNLMQNCGDATYWLCLTRTVQGSKLFPVSPYILLSYLNAFYRYPTLLKKIEARMRAEVIADRARNMGMKITNSALGWAMPNFYLLGRELLLTLGFLRPQDALEDVVYVMDFWKRYLLSWHRNDGHITNREYGNRAQILPDRRLEVFHHDLYPCQPGDALHEAAHTFLATISQYGFLVSCESRISLTNSGPYRIDDRHQLVVRDFMDLAECSLPWLDGVARDVPYNYLTVPTLVRDCKFRLVDDWGSFEATPEFTAEHLAGVGLYTSDALSEGFLPVGMGSAAELTDTFNALNATFKAATNKLWLRIAGWSRDQMIDAGALTYYNIIKDLAHVAGVFEVDDWLTIDPRAERFRPLLNDDFSNQLLGSLVVGMDLPGHRQSPYQMMQYSDGASRVYTPLPYSVLAGEDYVPGVGPIQKGASHLDPKVDRYRTTAGVLTLDEYNRRAREFTPEACQDKYRFLCETWVKYNYRTPLAGELYRLEQRSSRTQKDRGAGRRDS